MNDPTTEQQLVALTHQFYGLHARSFSNSRQAPWSVWRVLPPIKRGRVLDLGCGNGRFLRFIRSNWGFEGDYVGLDACPQLLADAARQTPPDAHSRWVQGDLLCEPWPGGEYDLVVAWGLLHHIPGAKQRLRVLAAMADTLAPGAKLLLSFWQFNKHERFIRKQLDPAAYGIDPTRLEPGDALLDWGDDHSVPRYCHHFSDAEVATLGSELLSLRPVLSPLSLSAVEPTASDRFNAYLGFLRLS